jgi:hypothetical protein
MNELALDVKVMWLLILSLFIVFLVTALAGPVVAGVSSVGLWIYALATGRAEMRRAEAEPIEAEAAVAVTEAEAAAAEAEKAREAAVLAEAEAVVAAEQLRLLLGGS